MEQERVATRALEPAPRALGRVVRIERPGDQDGGERARREHRGRGADDELRDRVAAHAAVPEQVRALGRDDVRRVGDDEVEVLAFDRLEEAALSHLDVADAVELRVERRIAERPRVHVRRDHALGMRCEQDRLDPVAGTEVERMLALAANGQVGESDGRAVDARHVVGVRFRGAGVVGRDEQLVVRNDARSPVDDLRVPDEKPCAGEAPQ